MGRNWLALPTALLFTATLFVFSAGDAIAAKAKFRAGVNPARLSLTVNAQGGITGTKTATVDVHRTQVGSSYACNKIQAVEVLKGTDPLPLDESLVLSRFSGFPDRKGRCYFDINLTVQPFSDDEIRGACQSVSGGTQSLLMDGLVTAWNKPADYLTYLRDMRRKGGQGGGIPKNTSPVKFAATVNCASAGASRGGGFRIPNIGTGGVGSASGGGSASGVGSTGSSAQCDLTGTWAGYNNGQRGTGWKFDQIFTSGGSVTYRATHLTAQGSPSGSEGAMTRSSSGNYLFHTLATRVPGANATYQASTMRIYDADASCSKLTERQLYDSTTGMVNRPGNYWLQKAGAAPRPAGSPVGKPAGPTTFRPRKAPAKPGSGFQPGPNTPKPVNPSPWKRTR